METVEIRKAFGATQLVSIEISIKNRNGRVRTITGECTGINGIHWSDVFGVVDDLPCLCAKQDHTKTFATLKVSLSVEETVLNYNGILKTFSVKKNEWEHRSILDTPDFGFVPYHDEDEVLIDEFFAKLSTSLPSDTDTPITVLVLEQEGGEHSCRGRNRVRFYRSCEANQSGAVSDDGFYWQMCLAIAELNIPVYGELIMIHLSGE